MSSLPPPPNASSPLIPRGRAASPPILSLSRCLVLPTPNTATVASPTLSLLHSRASPPHRRCPVAGRRTLNPKPEPSRRIPLPSSLSHIAYPRRRRRRHPKTSSPPCPITPTLSLPHSRALPLRRRTLDPKSEPPCRRPTPFVTLAHRTPPSSPRRCTPSRIAGVLRRRKPHRPLPATPETAPSALPYFVGRCFSDFLLSLRLNCHHRRCRLLRQYLVMQSIITL